MHIPKTGGMTAQQYLTCCLGGKRGGRRCKLGEIYLHQSPDERKIERARASRFICGHFSWASVERIGIRDDDYIFTFLREPRSRLQSFYRVMTNYPKDHLTEAVMSRVERCRDMSQLDMFTTSDLDLRNMIDNYMVRQLSGRLVDYPFRESEWPALLEIAKRNLRRLNRVGLQETYEADFGRVLCDLDLPRLPVIPRDNATDDVVKRAWVKGKTYQENPADIQAAMAPLVRWDDALYDYARELRASGAFGPVA
ncbi:sulfotransferase family 2 domain-containing protein [Hypericibacter terrae]|nr:sulfotransferase family 2 domain-containing protein [Hypericibacter terrae]